MNWMTKTISALIPCASLLLACSPAAPGQGTGSSAAQPQPPKVLTIAHTREAATIDGYTGEGGGSGGADMYALLHDKLIVTNPQGVVQPLLATEVPSIDRGTWQLLPDGRMVMTWKLRQGVKWHDGAPFTSDDMMFALTLRKDPELAHSQRAIANQMESATNPDPYTFIVTWKSVYVQANEAPALPPQPKHLHEDLYKSDKTAFINSARFREEYIGLGPFRMTGWERTVHMELAAFSDYWQGRPMLDRIVIRFFNDPNTVIANLLAEAVDLVVPPTITAEGAFELRRRWEGTGHVTRIEPVPTLDYIEPMIRPDFARPVNGMPQLVVRQAMMHAIDRAALTETVTGGLGPIAHSHWFPEDAMTAQLESVIVKYAYDVPRARQLLSQAGWEPGPDGILVHRPSGERFDLDLMSNETLAVKVGTIIADDWKRIGIAAVSNPIPPARSQDREFTARRTGPLATFSFGDWSSDRLYGKDMASEANRWSGRNRAGYQNPRSDTVLEQLKETVDPAARLALLREQVQIYTADLALMPLYWETRTVLALKTVKGDIRPANQWWQARLWDKVASLP